MENILSEVLERTVPGKEEEKELKDFADSVISKINDFGYEAELEGSLAKGTWNAGSHDLDIFVFFKKKTNRKELEEKGVSLGKKVVKSLGAEPEVAYAEHPYVKTEVNGYQLDIVPCYKHKELGCLKSAVDRTPFHTEYIKEKLTEEQKNEVRLLKRFMKGIGVYSAREKVHGFSGYLCELLILNYGSFKETIKSAENWSHGVLIDLEDYYKEKTKALEKFDCPLVVIDPIDKNRNVAAALEEDNFDLFVYASEEFLKKPNINFFFPNPVEPLSREEFESEIEKRSPFFLIKFKAPDLVEDTLHSQLRSSLSSLSSAVERKDFKLLGSDFMTNEYSCFLLDLEYDELPEIEKLRGPPTDVEKKSQDAFKEKYEEYEPWVEDERWYAEVPREFTDARSAISKILEEPRRYGVAKFISKAIKKNYTLLKDLDIKEEYEGKVARFLTTYLTKKKPWEW